MSDIFPPNFSLSQLLHSAQPFALLDDAQADAAQSRLYYGLQRVAVCRELSDWPGFIHTLETALRDGYYGVALLSYETGAQLQDITPHDGAAVSRVAIFRHCLKLNSTQVAQLLREIPASVAGIADIRPDIDESAFCEAIKKIQTYIAAGDTYQVNYTYRLHFDAYGDPLALYRRLRERQPVPYGALICMPEGDIVISMSPELFIRHQQGNLYAKPMKGTAAATGDTLRDQQLAAGLAADTKNRAENLMIVDLLRNDLGRIAETGSVQVPQLFEVNRFSSVLQMTSTIHARLRADLGLVDILNALFPCGSITGAPKRRTMEIIREIEPAARDLYTGAIGWFDPPQHTNMPGDFCLSVPIRTMQLQVPDTDAGPSTSVRKGVMGVGAGIVYDSRADEEFAECQLKAKFLTGLPAQFELFETMYATRELGCRYWTRHLHRLRGSAQYFGFVWNEAEIIGAVQGFCANLPPYTAYRLRLAVNTQGQVAMTSGVLTPLSADPRAMLAQQTTSSDELFLRHKSSIRQSYDEAWKAAEAHGAFDMLFFNEQGYLTEGGRSNVLIQKDGIWLTPPLSDGVLPGVMRSVLLEEPEFQQQYNVREQSLTRADLDNADQIMLCNALRGAFTVRLLQR
ncbi:aminodeoxychorismate synthase component I [Undibacterium sp. WLHG33]|uniref:aminodeoxychorismate synthase component I n=1 Tax=Undibacterium sp. WLHG33 TaxID=3412482 RepID=UPI003C2F7145